MSKTRAQQTWDSYNKHQAAKSVPSTEGMSATKCIGDDPICPCRDGDACHYKGDNPFSLPSAYQRSAVLAPEAEGMEARLPEQYRGRWTYDYDEKSQRFQICTGGYCVAETEDSEVADFICKRKNDARVEVVRALEAACNHIKEVSELREVAADAYDGLDEFAMYEIIAAAIRKQIAELGKQG